MFWKEKEPASKPAVRDPLCSCFVQSGSTHRLPIGMFKNREATTVSHLWGHGAGSETEGKSLINEPAMMLMEWNRRRTSKHR